jgi:hypothetical protein
LNDAASHRTAIAINEPPRPTRLFAPVPQSPPTSTQERPPRRAATEPGPQEGASLNGTAAHHAAIAIDEPPRGGDGARRYLYSIDFLAFEGGTVEIDPETATERGGRTPPVRRVSIVVVRDMILEQVHVEKRLREVGRPQRQLKMQSHMDALAHIQAHTHT